MLIFNIESGRNSTKILILQATYFFYTFYLLSIFILYILNDILFNYLIYFQNRNKHTKNKQPVNIIQYTT